MSDWQTLTVHVLCFVKEEVLAPPPENDDVVNDFDIEEEVIEVENRLDICDISVFFFNVTSIQPHIEA